MTPLEAIAEHGVDVPLPPPTPADRPCGVYLLVSAGRVIYVGATSNLPARIANHFHGLGRGTKPKVFDRAIWILLPRAELPAYEGALIRALRPPLNTRLPAPRGRDLEILSRLGLPPHDEKAVHAELQRASYKPRPNATRPKRPRAKRGRS